DSLAGAALSLDFQGESEHHQGNDHGRYVVELLGQLHPREDLWRHNGHTGIEPGGGGADGDQRIHVGLSMPQAGPHAAEELAARPEHDRQGHDAKGTPYQPTSVATMVSHSRSTGKNCGYFKQKTAYEMAAANQNLVSNE